MSERQEFTPVEVTKIGQLEHLLQAEREVRQFRGFTEGTDHNAQIDNPDFSPEKPEEPTHYTVLFDKNLLRGMITIKKALRYDIIVDETLEHHEKQPYHTIDQDKLMIVDGLIDAYEKPPPPYLSEE